MNDPRYNAVPTARCDYIECGLMPGHAGPHKSALDLCAGVFDLQDTTSDYFDGASVQTRVERSSLGTPEAVALRATVTDEQAARVVARAKELAEVDRIAKILGAHRRFFRIGCRCGYSFDASPMDGDAILAEHEEHVARVIADPINSPAVTTDQP